MAGTNPGTSAWMVGASKARAAPVKNTTARVLSLHVN
jgi:hypothetical protein